MQRESKSKYVILGFLAQEELSGYDIKKMIEERLAGIWEESFGQIYPSLQALEDDGWTQKSIYRQEGKPDRHTYRITSKGEEALRAWLRKPAGPHKERVESLMKLYFGAVLTPEENITSIERFRKEHADRISACRDLEARLQDEYTASPALPYWLLTLHCSLQVSRAYVNWCDDAMAILQQRQQSADSAPRSRRPR